MKKLQWSLCALGAYVVFVTILALTSSRPATGQGNGNGNGQPPAKDVRVINTPSEPVPVTGTIEVGALPAVQLDTTHPIQVKDVDNPARQPFTINLTVKTDTGASFSVPAGKRLVISHVDAFTQTEPDNIVIYSTVNSQSSELNVPFNVVTGPLATNHQASQLVMDFADPGTTVRVSFYAFKTGQARVNIHGYYVDIP